MASSLLQDPGHRPAFKRLLEPSSGRVVVETEVRVLDVDFLANGSAVSAERSITPDTMRTTARPRLRVIFAPVDYPTEENQHLLLGLADLFEIPSCFLHERTQSVTHSFNFEGSHTSAFRTWLHFLCKAIVPDHDFYLWVRCGFFLCRSPQDETTLVCFGASKSLQSRIESLPGSTWSDLDRDPTGVFCIILADLHNILDEQVWTINDSVGQFERFTIKSSLTEESFKQNFNDLHYIAKNTIHLQESSEAALATCRALLSSLPSTSSSTAQSTSYLLTLFTSTLLRTSSLTQRIQNTITLSFHLTTESTAQSVKSESSSMHTIAFATLVFLPLSTVATIFGSQFFAFTPPSPIPQPGQNAETGEGSFVLSSTFWLFWAIAIPLTLVVLGIWLCVHHKRVRKWFAKKTNAQGAGTSSDDVRQLGKDLEGGIGLNTLRGYKSITT